MFTELLGTDYEFVNSSSDCHLNYSKEFGGKMHIIPHGLLSEVDIRSDIEIYFEKSNNQWFTFRTSDATEMSFDVFAASFYLVSRYEEYLSYEPDDHNRYTAGFSCLSQHDLLMEPLVNQWAFYIKNELIKGDSDLEFLPRKFEYLSTVDIDQAWKFKYKGIKRNVLGTLRDLKEGKWENFKDRWPILLGFKKDPFYEAFHWHKLQEIKYDIKPNYFVLVGDYGTFDKNTSYKHIEFQQLIKSLDDEDSLGIHPSYQSNIEIDRVATESDRLSSILDRSISTSRQHFLMHTMPATYRLLLKLGIKEDHTMGYSTHLGFRAGIAAPFYWFDLENNEQTELRLVPFCAMDITPLHYRGESPSEATETIDELLQKVHEVDGLFVSLWHNESFSETERWIGWSSVYVRMLDRAKELKP
jgi:hypothetical protein